MPSAPRRPKATAEFSAPWVEHPKSLWGTEVDGDIELDGNGNALPTRELRLLFDYFLATLGERDLEQVATMIRQFASTRVPASSVASVMRIFRQYRTYLRRAERAQAAADSLRSLLEHHRHLQSLRNEILGPNAAAVMFSGDDAILELLLEQQSAGLRSLSPDARRTAQENLEAELPPGIRDLRAAIWGPTLVRQQVDEALLAGASEQEVWDLRATHFGAAAADRLRVLDLARANRAGPDAH